MQAIKNVVAKQEDWEGMSKRTMGINKLEKKRRDNWNTFKILLELIKSSKLRKLIGRNDLHFVNTL